MWTILLSTLAWGGDLTLEAKKPCLVILDGTAVEFPEGRMKVEAEDLEQGRHHLEVRSIGGKRITELEFRIGHEETISVAYAKKRLTIIDRVSPVEEEPEPEVAAVEDDTTEADLDDPELDALEEPETVQVGSIQFVAPASATIVFAATEVDFSTASESFTVTEVVPGTYDVKVTQDGKVIHTSEQVIEAGQNQKCLLSDAELSCELVSPQLGLPEIALEAVTRRVESVIAETAPELVDEGPLEVVIAPADPMDLSSVFMDGALLYKVRKGTVTHTTTLDQGAHVLEIRGFGGEVWVRGKLVVDGEGPLSVTFDSRGDVRTNRDAEEREEPVFTSLLDAP